MISTEMLLRDLGNDPLTTKSTNQDQSDTYDRNREHAEVRITDFVEIWHKCSFQKKYLTRIFFIGNRQCRRSENYLQSWGCATYFAKYLGIYRRYCFLRKLMKLEFF